MLPRIFFFFLLTIFVSFISVHNLFSENKQISGPHFKDVIVTTSNSHILLFGELQNSMTEEMIEGLHSGIPINFSFFIRLERNETNWPDEEMVVIEFSHMLRYDTLKEQYIVETEEKNKKKESFSNLAEATKILTEINGLKITELSNLRPDNTYRIMVKADLYKKTLPMSLHTIIPFVSWWDLSTDWFTVEFTY